MMLFSLEIKNFHVVMVSSQLSDNHSDDADQENQVDLLG